VAELTYISYIPSGDVPHNQNVLNCTWKRSILSLYRLLARALRASLAQYRGPHLQRPTINTQISLVKVLLWVEVLSLAEYVYHKYYFSIC
jgi:hypothetical protein